MGQSKRLAGEEGVAVNLVAAGVRLASRAGEGVDRRADPHVGEPGLLEEECPACARQAAGDSAGPQVDVA
jgi:hypothetical protein